MRSALRVLVADDHEDTRDSFALLLESCGYTVDTAGSCDEVRALVRDAGPYCLIVLDLHMPGDCWQLLPELTTGRTAGVPIALVTGDVYALRRDPPPPEVRVMIKPIDPNELIALAESYCAA